MRELKYYYLLETYEVDGCTVVTVDNAYWTSGKLDLERIRARKAENTTRDKEYLEKRKAETERRKANEAIIRSHRLRSGGIA